MGAVDAASTPRQADSLELMGDPACHLSSVCLSCGRFVEDADAATCPHCGEPTDGSTDQDHPGPVFTAHQVNTILYCEAFEETVDFYRSRLLLEVTFSNEWFYEFRLDTRTTLSVADAGRATISSAGGEGMTLSIEVEDLDGLRRRLEERGIETTAISTRFGSRVFDIHDPEGHRIEFWTG